MGRVRDGVSVRGMDLLQAVHDLGEALLSAQRLSLKWQAWRQLNVIDASGASYVRPYTHEAISTLETSYALNESDYDVVHHLAIAYHAKAWDLELRESDAALEAWEKALFYWRRLQTYGAFWQDLYAKGEALGKAFDRHVVEEFRRNLTRYLLEIHVNFIRYYCELKRPDQASRHIELIRRAQIPPATRKELEVLAYGAMTATVPDVVIEGHLDDALAILDGYLGLFSSYLPALQLYLEVAKRWVEQMAPASQWLEIVGLDRRVTPRWDALNALEQVPENSLAQAALVDLASVLGGKHWARARDLRRRREEESQQPCTLECEEYQANERAVWWLKKTERAGVPCSPESRFNLLNASMCRAEFLAYVGLNSDDPSVTYRLLEEGFSSCQKIMEIAPDEMAPRKLAAQILEARAEHRVAHLVSSGNALDFATCLENAKQDLLDAVRLDPDNPPLQEKLHKLVESLGEMTV